QPLISRTCEVVRVERAEHFPEAGLFTTDFGGSVHTLKLAGSAEISTTGGAAVGGAAPRLPGPASGMHHDRPLRSRREAHDATGRAVPQAPHRRTRAAARVADDELRVRPAAVRRRVEEPHL